jgi:hypothetical protein
MIKNTFIIIISTYFIFISYVLLNTNICIIPNIEYKKQNISEPFIFEEKNKNIEYPPIYDIIYYWKKTIKYIDYHYNPIYKLEQIFDTKIVCDKQLDIDTMKHNIIVNNINKDPLNPLDTFYHTYIPCSIKDKLYFTSNENIIYVFDTPFGDKYIRNDVIGYELSIDDEIKCNYKFYFSKNDTKNCVIHPFECHNNIGYINIGYFEDSNNIIEDNMKNLTITYNTYNCKYYSDDLYFKYLFTNDSFKCYNIFENPHFDLFIH